MKELFIIYCHAGQGARKAGASSGIPLSEGMFTDDVPSTRVLLLSSDYGTLGHTFYIALDQIAGD